MSPDLYSSLGESAACLAAAVERRDLRGVEDAVIGLECASRQAGERLASALGKAADGLDALMQAWLSAEALSREVQLAERDMGHIRQQHERLNERLGQLAETEKHSVLAYDDAVRRYGVAMMSEEDLARHEHVLKDQQAEADTRSRLKGELENKLAALKGMRGTMESDIARLQEQVANMTRDPACNACEELRVMAARLLEIRKETQAKPADGCDADA